MGVGVRARMSIPQHAALTGSFDVSNMIMMINGWERRARVSAPAHGHSYGATECVSGAANAG